MSPLIRVAVRRSRPLRRPVVKLTNAVLEHLLVATSGLPVLREDQCTSCGCTDSRACLGGCWWVAPGLCSACAPQSAGLGLAP